MLKFKFDRCGTTDSPLGWHTICTYGILDLCNDCYHNTSSKQIKGLTTWEKKKLSFYKDDRKWQEDISGRRIMPDGKIGIYDNSGKLKEVRD